TASIPRIPGPYGPRRSAADGRTATHARSAAAGRPRARRAECRRRRPAGERCQFQNGFLRSVTYSPSTIGLSGTLFRSPTYGTLFRLSTEGGQWSTAYHHRAVRGNGPMP